MKAFDFLGFDEALAEMVEETLALVIVIFQFLGALGRIPESSGAVEEAFLLLFCFSGSLVELKRRLSCQERKN